MRRTMIWALALVLATASAAQLAAQAKSVMVGGAAMLPSRNIVENAMHSQDHTTLVAAVKAAGLVETLQSKAPSRCSRRPTQPSRSCLPERSTRCCSLPTKRPCRVC